MLESIPIKLLISTLLGASIGLERESSGQGSHAVAGGGLRTYSLVSLLGAIAGLFYLNNYPWVFVLLSLGFLGLLISYYMAASKVSQDFGLTTEIAFVLTYAIGVLTTTGIIPLQLIIALAVVFILILSLKTRTRDWLSEVTRHEVEGFISYGIVALVVLPFLPNTSYTLANIPFVSDLLTALSFNMDNLSGIEILNPRKVWFIVVLVTGIDILGYTMSKFVGKKNGFALTSFVGGFVSSTSTTQSLAQKSKKSNATSYLVSAAVLANLASFIQIILLVAPLNSRFLVAMFPTIIILVAASALFAWYFYKRKDSKLGGEEQDQTSRKLFSLAPALKFALLIVGVKIFTSVSLVFFGESGFLISSVIASLAGIDAILVNLAGMAGSTVTFKFALLAFILVNATNLLSKTVYSFLQGSRSFSMKFLAFTLGVIAASSLGLLFV